MLLKQRAVAQIAAVIAGLDIASRVYPTCDARLMGATQVDPSCDAIHLLAKMMDARVKPAHDDQSERPGFFDLPL
jgi:hypothetical protein